MIAILCRLVEDEIMKWFLNLYFSQTKEFEHFKKPFLVIWISSLDYAVFSSVAYFWSGLFPFLKGFLTWHLLIVLWEHECHGVLMELRGQFVTISSLLPPFQFQKVNWVHQTCQQIPLPIESSHQPRGWLLSWCLVLAYSRQQSCHIWWTMWSLML